MDPLARVRNVMDEVAGAEARLGRSVATGKSADGTVAITITGAGKVRSLELDGGELGLKEDQAAAVVASVVQAIEAALAKRTRRARREIERINS